MEKRMSQGAGRFLNFKQAFYNGVTLIGKDFRVRSYCILLQNHACVYLLDKVFLVNDLLLVQIWKNV